MVRNPRWHRDELVLALDLYLRHRRVLDDTHPDVIAVSQMLNALPTQGGRPDAARFRNPNGVSLRLANFAHLDPAHAGKGMKNVGPARAIWEEMGSDPERVHALAEAICRGVAAPEVAYTFPEEGEEEFPEGTVMWRLHRARERNASIRRRLTQAALRTGPLACAVCAFDFAARYGPIGAGFIECHHIKPVSELRPGEATRLKDVVLLCANCHRMVHRRRPWLTLSQLSTLIVK